MISKIFFLISLFLLPFAFCFSDPFMNDQGAPSEALLQLLDTMEVSHDGSWKSIVENTQKAWLRPKDKERWEVEDAFADKREEVLPLLRKLGIIDEVSPHREHYDTGVLFGGTLPSFRLRLAYLVEQWNRGVRFDSLVVLCSDRPLKHPKEAIENFLDRENGVLPIRDGWTFNGVIPQTEKEMVELVFDQAALPEEWREMKINFIQSLGKMGEDGTFQRATTWDTLADFAAQSNKKSSVLFTSSQPFIGYQAAVVKSVGVWEDFEVCGPGISSFSVAICLDNVARILYQTWFKI